MTEAPPHFPTQLPSPGRKRVENFLTLMRNGYITARLTRLRLLHYLIADMLGLGGKQRSALVDEVDPCAKLPVV